MQERFTTFTFWRQRSVATGNLTSLEVTARLGVTKAIELKLLNSFCHGQSPT